MDIEHVRNTVTFRHIRKSGRRDRAVPAHAVLGGFTTLLCLILVAVTVLGCLLMLFQWVAVSLPPNLLLPCADPVRCGRTDHGERHEVLFDTSRDAPEVLP
jgi:hypothetical protein